MTTVNINDQCQVVLTKDGCQQMADYYTQFWKGPISVDSPTAIEQLEKVKIYKEGHVYEDSLWSIMNIFGEACYPSAAICFKNNEIIIYNKPEQVEEKKLFTEVGDSVYFED